MSETCKNAPDKIFLQWGDGSAWNSGWDDGVTWCVDQINDDDVGYVQEALFDGVAQELKNKTEVLEAYIAAWAGKNIREIEQQNARMKSIMLSILAIVRDPANRGAHSLHQQCKLMDRINDMIETGL
jgi:hypothetical protein